MRRVSPATLRQAIVKPGTPIANPERFASTRKARNNPRPMDFFRYKNGELYCEDVPAERIAREVGTACYVYSKATFLHHYRQIRDAFSPLNPTICYSVKSCGNINILRFLAQEGCGFDVTSGGELFRAIEARGDQDHRPDRPPDRAREQNRMVRRRRRVRCELCRTRSSQTRNRAWQSARALAARQALQDRLRAGAVYRRELGHPVDARALSQAE